MIQLPLNIWDPSAPPIYRGTDDDIASAVEAAGLTGKRKRR